MSIYEVDNLYAPDRERVEAQLRQARAELERKPGHTVLKLSISYLEDALASLDQVEQLAAAAERDAGL